MHTDPTAAATLTGPRSAADAAGEPVLSLREVHFGYEPGRAVVDGITAGLRPGRLTVMIGPNAAGKSTLLRLMLGQLRAWSGQVALEGEDVADLSPGERARRISYMPQRGGVSFAFTVREVVEMGRFAQAADADAVEQALSDCDLHDIADSVFTHLSGGQQQRVLLARALAQTSGTGRAVLADEPVSSMDLWHVHRTMANLRRLATAGLAVLAVLHDLTLAAAYADDVWLVDHGRLLRAGAWADVLTPEVLSPVYRVDLRSLRDEASGSDRPVLVADARAASDTMPALIDPSAMEATP